MYWPSKKQESLLSERQEQLDLLFQFANSELKNENGQLVGRIHDLLKTVAKEHKESCPDSLKAENDELKYGLQKHLCARLKKVIHNTNLLWEMTLFKIGGSVEFTMDAKNKRFYERFRLRKMKPGNELKVLKRIVDLALIEIFRDLSSKPNRFRQCPKCGRYFYQPTKRKKSYCSIRCGDAVRLQKFRRERREIEK